MASDCFKRHRMVIDIATCHERIAAPPAGYLYIPWHADLLDVHAQVKFDSFSREIDSSVFPCLGDAEGCRKLMREIVGRPGFLPGATWLAVHHPDPESRAEYCGTIQGIRTRERHGSIQNVGVTREHRQHGIGRGLIARALQGFRAAGLERACLEVTAKNVRAVALYRRLGFRSARTVYKTAEVPAFA